MQSQTTILQDLGLDNLSPEEQEAILLEFNDLIVDGALVRLMEKMDEKTLTEFEALIDSDASDEEMDVFIKKHVPNSDKILADTVQELRDDILAVTSK